MRMPPFPDGLYQVFLAGKMRVDAAGTQSGLADDVLNGRLMKSLARKTRLGSLEDFVAPGRQPFRFHFWHSASLPRGSQSARLTDSKPVYKKNEYSFFIQASIGC